jgi:hypothetical protein
MSTNEATSGTLAGALAAAPLTADERRAGYRRLVVVSAVIVGVALLTGLVFVALGADLASGVGAGIGLVGILMVIGGVVAFSRTASVRRSNGDIRLASASERKAAERLALGLLAGGILFSVVSLVVA